MRLGSVDRLLRRPLTATLHGVVFDILFGRSAQHRAEPDLIMLLVSNSGHCPDQQEGGAERDQRKAGPIRFEAKAAGRSFWFQGVARLPGAKSPPTA
jgi:hypothetical protein